MNPHHSRIVVNEANSRNLDHAKITVFTIDELLTFEPRHEISKNVVCATSIGSDQPAHTRSLIRAFASRLHIAGVFSY